ncbi:MAG TPA: NGG1p interacting factor NIF3 [Nitrospirae bacterium]|nr:NGG1p interacting factor 3 [bacterium BMS3Abin06]HDH12320.1 NGG1p interacting factor NIF3 [Nitrospirota bacterium]HDZ01719.1 NGG1p interacting factor NIF3 [Nitrospirota bacterium]
MKLKKIYETVIAKGIEADPRDRKTVLRSLDKTKKKYREMKKDEKEFFDIEILSNPYADTRILHGTGEEEIRTALIGIDMEAGELLLADRLSSRGEKIDLVIAHHPEGKAFANFYEVMHMQADILNKFGVPINIAEGLLEGRIKEVERRLSPVNHTRAADAARLLDMPFMCMHTPADNMVAGYLQKAFDRKAPDSLDDVLKILNEIPEYREAAKNNAGPKILLGSKERSAGKIFVDMTGGTEGAKEIFESLVNSGVNTIVGMHLSEEHRKEAEKRHMNVVIAGHISSDNLGVNLMLDELQKKGKLNIVACSGFRRFSRLK